MKRYKVGNFFLGMVPMYCYLVVNSAISLLISFLVSFYGMMHGKDPLQAIEPLADYQNIIMLTIVVQVVVSIIGYLVYYFVFREKTIEAPDKVMSAKTFGAIAVLALGAQFIIGIVLSFAMSFFPKLMENYEKLIENYGITDNSTIALISIIILAPIMEEVLFRGMTFRLARKWSMNFWAANIFQAALFGIAHLNIVQGIYAFLLGLLLGWIYRKTNSLLGSIWLHMVFNFGGTVGVNLLFGNDDPAMISLMSVVTAFAGIIGLIFGIWVIREDTKAKEREAIFFERLNRGK